MADLALPRLRARRRRRVSRTGPNLKVVERKLEALVDAVAGRDALCLEPDRTRRAAGAARRRRSGRWPSSNLNRPSNSLPHANYRGGSGLGHLRRCPRVPTTNRPRPQDKSCHRNPRGFRGAAAGSWSAQHCEKGRWRRESPEFRSSRWISRGIPGPRGAVDCCRSDSLSFVAPSAGRHCRIGSWLNIRTT